MSLDDRLDLAYFLMDLKFFLEVITMQQMPALETTEWRGLQRGPNQLRRFQTSNESYEQVSTMLRDMNEYARFQLPFLPDRLQYPARTIWQDDMREQIERIASLLRLDEEESDLDTELSRVGLTGMYLDFKLRAYLIRPSIPMVRSGNTSAPYRERDSQGRFVRAFSGRVREWLQWILKYADVILGSLTSVIPPAELLQEYKEIIELGLTDK